MKNVSRREFLKIIGALGTALPFSKNVKRLHFAEMESNQAKLPNIIIIVLDALSAKHMSLYGYQRDTTKHIDNFANVSTVYHHHYAAGNYTIPSTASLFTGTYPWTHRAFHIMGFPLKYFSENNIFSKLSSDLCKKLAYTHNPQAFYILSHMKKDIDNLIPINELTEFTPFHIESRGFLFRKDFSIGHSAFRDWLFGLEKYNAVFLHPFHSMKRDLKLKNEGQKYLKTFPDGLPEVDDGYIYGFYWLEDAIDYIYNSISSLKKPQFSYFHLYPPHGPYRPRVEFFDLFKNDGLIPPEKPKKYFDQNKDFLELKNLQQRYDEFIAYADSEIGRLFDLFDKSGILDTSYVILTSDHGELFERGIHGHLTPTLYESLIHIPLIIHSPGQENRVDITSISSTVDIMPTIFQIYGQQIPDWCEGMSLFNLNETVDRSIYIIEGKENPKTKPLNKATLGIIRWPHKLINYRGYRNYGDNVELYNIQDDPEELRNIASLKPSMVSEMKQELLNSLIYRENISLTCLSD